jgi:hypothetical protein
MKIKSMKNTSSDQSKALGKEKRKPNPLHVESYRQRNTNNYYSWFYRVKIDKTAEIKIHDETHDEHAP